MQMVSSDILADVRELSTGLTILGLLIGVWLWTFGWRSHRFWVVLSTTVLAGIWGLNEGTNFQATPLVAALLLAIAAGLLALAVVQVVAFFAGGLAGLWIVQTAAPMIEQQLVVFLVAGLLGLFLFRIWWMALTALVGTLLVSYCGLALLDHAGTMDAVGWTCQGQILLNWLCGFLAFLGLSLQYMADRRRRAEAGGGEGLDIRAIFSRAFGWMKLRKAS